MENEWNIQLDGSWPFWAYIQHNCDGQKYFSKVNSTGNDHIINRALRLTYIPNGDNHEYKPRNKMCPLCGKPVPEGILMQAELRLRIKYEDYS